MTHALCIISNQSSLGSNIRRTMSVGCFPERNSDENQRSFQRRSKDAEDELYEVIRHLQDLQPLKSCISNKNLCSMSDHDPIASKIPRSVSFTKLEIREHPLTIGNVSDKGIPTLSLDWYNEEEEDVNKDNKLKCKTIEV